MNVLPPSSLSPVAASAPEHLAAVACPACFGAVAVRADLFGKAAECPICRSGFRVPFPSVAEAASQPAAGTGRRPKPATTNPVARPPEHPASGAATPEWDPEPSPPVELQFSQPVRTVGSGDNVIELRRLTPAEKATRRARRTIIMMCVGVSLLMAIVLLLGTKPTKRR